MEDTVERMLPILEAPGLLEVRRARDAGERRKLVVSIVKSTMKKWPALSLDQARSLEQEYATPHIRYSFGPLDDNDTNRLQNYVFSTPER